MLLTLAFDNRTSKLNFSIRSRYCEGTFVFVSTKVSLQPDGSACTYISLIPNIIFDTILNVIYRVTHEVGENLPLTLIWKLHCIIMALY